MTVGIVGLGKLGLPVAAAIAHRGHEVVGYDLRPDALDVNHVEAGLPEVAFDDARQAVSQVSHSELVKRADLIFVAVQTPHSPTFEGVTPLPSAREDFDYGYLWTALSQLERCGKPVAVISTVLPGTLSDRDIYNPSFIAMGTTMRDFLHPEFVLLGGEHTEPFAEFYRTITDAPIYQTGVREAETIKVAYNTFIGMKIAFANTLMEVCHRQGSDIDEVTDALKLAERRLISPAYLSGGMGDGGACHPRDNIALSWLARNLDLSYDLFDAIMRSREASARWLVELMCEHDLPKAVLGVAFKAGSAITTGSAAMLCVNLLREAGESPVLIDQRVGLGAVPRGPHVFLVGCNHPDHVNYRFPPGSVVIDPWRYIPPQEGVTVVGVGAVPHDRAPAQSESVPARAA